MRRIALWLVVVFGFALVWRTGANVFRLWKTGERVKAAQRQLVEAKTENEQLKKQLEVVQSPEFMEKEAREKLGYGRPGEVVVIIPEDAAAPAAEALDEPQPNWVVWRRLYLGF